PAGAPSPSIEKRTARGYSPKPGWNSVAGTKSAILHYTRITPPGGANFRHTHGSRRQRPAETDRSRCRRPVGDVGPYAGRGRQGRRYGLSARREAFRSEEHTSELQSRENLVCR